MELEKYNWEGFSRQHQRGVRIDCMARQPTDLNHEDFVLLQPICHNHCRSYHIPVWYKNGWVLYDSARTGI